VQDIYPLAPLQEGILFHHLMDSDGDAYLLPSLYGFASKAQLERVLAALQQVINRHDILRTRLAWDGLSQPVQVVLRQVQLPVVELELDPQQVAEVQLQERFDPAHTRIAIDEAPLLRCHIAEEAGSGRWLLHVLAHHLVIDHTTVELLLNEAQQIEAGRVAELPAPLPFRNFVAQARLGVSAQEHEDFFRKMLGDVDEPTAPFGMLDVQSDGLDIDEAHLLLEGELTAALRNQARARGVSVASLMHLAWALVLARTTGRDDVVFGTVLFGRLQGGAQADRVLGMFINTLPVRVQLTGLGVADALKQTHQLLAQLLRHEHAPLALAQRCSAVGPLAPLFTALLNYRHTPLETDFEAAVAESGAAVPTAEELVEEISARERTNYPLGLSVDDLGQAIVLTAQVAAPVTAQQVCELMNGALQAVVSALQQTPSQAVAELDVLPAAQRDLLVARWNDTEAPFADTQCLHELFEQQAALRPDALALVHGDIELSYGELNAAANRLARHLRARGLQTEGRVALFAERGVALVQAILAVHKAGGAYVPLDPAYPEERLVYMLRDSAPQLVLSCGGHYPDVLEQAGVEDTRVIDLLADQASWAGEATANLPAAEVGLTPRSLAYVIYTSGSTGQPKGVMNAHRGLTNLVQAQIDAFGVTANSRVLQFASPSFDASISEVGMALACGAALCLAPRDAMMPGRPLLQTLHQKRISHVTLPPSALPVCEAEHDLPFHAETLIVAGEAIQPKDANRWSEGRRLINAYGPTEAAVCATTHLCQPEPLASVVPIGKPIANVRVYLLDARLRPVPLHAAGELYIGGVGVARGYLNQPGMTAERFIRDPFSNDPSARLYKTGDLGRWRADGAIEYLGRNDFQVKVRGFRIELGEIEARLSHCPEIQEVAVLAREDVAGDKRLVAYYVGAASVEALRAYALDNLPQHMVPQLYVQLARMPLTPNGKLDRKALPAPEQGDYGSRAYVAPQGETEIAMAGLWAAVLQLEQIGRDDSFFELGGHSLLAVQLLSRVRQHFAVDVPLMLLFLKPTLAEFSAAIAADQLALHAGALLTKLREGNDELPLFFIHALEGNVGYAADLAQWLAPGLPVYGLNAMGLNEGEMPLRSIETMATRYLQAVRQAQPQGPYRLASWSAGGKVAYEMAHQLQQAGEVVEFLGLVDTLFQNQAMSDELNKWLSDPAQASEAERDRAMLLLNLQHVIGLPQKKVKQLAQLPTVDDILAAVAGEFDEQELQEIDMYKRNNAMQSAFVEAVSAYQPPHNSVPVHLFAATDSQRKDKSLGWAPLLQGRLSIVPVKGNHQSIMQTPRIAVLGQVLSAALPRQSAAVVVEA
jgi:amino acid adenylation domain-containing protein